MSSGRIASSPSASKSRINGRARPTETVSSMGTVEKGPPQSGLGASDVSAIVWLPFCVLKKVVDQVLGLCRKASDVDFALYTAELHEDLVW